MHRNSSLIIFLSLTAIVTAYICTEGIKLTPAELAEYSNLNDTTDWAPISKIGHCRTEDKDIEPHPPYHIPDPLESRKDRDRDRNENEKNRYHFTAYRTSNCRPVDSDSDNDNDDVIASVQNFGCGGRCYSITSSDSDSDSDPDTDHILSGYLQQQTSTAAKTHSYPTVDYFSGPKCRGIKIHRQRIPNGEYSSCDDVEYPDGARSFVIYQDC